jgi:hypothetical protein
MTTQTMQRNLTMKSELDADTVSALSLSLSVCACVCVGGEGSCHHSKACPQVVDGGTASSYRG